MNEKQVYEGFLKAALYEGLTLPEANQMWKQAGQTFRPVGGMRAPKASIPKPAAPAAPTAPPPPMPAPINPAPMAPPLPGAEGLNGAKGIDPKLLAAIAGLTGAGAGAGGMHMAHSGIEDQMAQAAQGMAQQPLAPPPQQDSKGIPPWAAALGGLGLGAGGAMAMTPSQDDHKKEDKQSPLPPLPPV